MQDRAVGLTFLIGDMLTNAEWELIRLRAIFATPPELCE